MRTYKSKKRGQAIVLVAIALVILIALAGLALDGGIAYAVKAKLSSAADAAAIAAGRALGEGTNDTERINSARAAARKFFSANFPSGYLRATPKPLQDSDIVIVHNANGSWDITVTATASVPTYFLRIIGDDTFNAKVLAETHKRDLDMVLVIDNTGSIGNISGDPQRLRTAAVNFVNRFDSSSDRLALIRFACGAQVMDQISNPGRGFNKTSVVNHINSMTFTGNTNFSEAFWRARDQLDSIPVANRSSFRVVVFFSDGSPNSFSSTFGGNSGVIITGDPTNCPPNCGSPSGLSSIGSVSCNSSAGSFGSTLPNYATWPPNGPPANKYGVALPSQTPPPNLSSHRPIVGTTINFENVNNSARNLPEDMANDARKDGIYVFTLGLGQLLTQNKSWGNHERGDTVLKNMANDPSANTYGETQSSTPPQPTGLYCFAADSSQLDACFTSVANQILRLTK